MQRVTPDLGAAFDPVEEALREVFLQALPGDIPLGHDKDTLGRLQVLPCWQYLRQ